SHFQLTVDSSSSHPQLCQSSPSASNPILKAFACHSIYYTMPLSDVFTRISQIIAPAFVLQIKKSLGINPGGDAELALQDSTQGMNRRVQFPSPWGEGRFAYGTDERERAARHVPGGPTLDNSDIIPDSSNSAAEDRVPTARRPTRRPRRVGKNRPVARAVLRATSSASGSSTSR
ncbi:hypothetical protein BKA70DRAFT_1527122, partial [Coprinopsis sp. MPI-PUGE-AT-0042]